MQSYGSYTPGQLASIGRFVQFHAPVTREIIPATLFAPERDSDKWTLVASPHGRERGLDWRFGVRFTAPLVPGGYRDLPGDEQREEAKTIGGSPGCVGLPVLYAHADGRSVLPGVLQTRTLDGLWTVGIILASAFEATVRYGVPFSPTLKPGCFSFQPGYERYTD